MMILGNRTAISTFVAVSGIARLGPAYLISTERSVEGMRILRMNAVWVISCSLRVFETQRGAEVARGARRGYFCQIFIVLSVLALARVCPSGVKAIDVTGLVCPVKVLRSSPVSVCQIFTV